MGINNCIIIYDSKLKIPLLSNEFIKKINDKNINCIIISDTANNVGLLKNYNDNNSIIISIGNNKIINEIYSFFDENTQQALYSHIPINVNDNLKNNYINSTDIENKINLILQETNETNLLKLNNTYFDSIIIGEDIFKFSKKHKKFKDKIKIIKDFIEFKKIFTNGNKKDLIYISAEECGNQFFYFGLISIYNNYNDVKVFDSDDLTFNVLLIKELDNKNIYKLFKSIFFEKHLDKKILEKCVVLNTDKIKIISNDKQKIYIDSEKKELLTGSEIEIEFDNNIKVLKYN